MVLTELHPESWMRATCTVSCCSDRCQGASTGEGTNYRTAAQQTLTLPWGQPSISLPCPPTLDQRPGTMVANSSPSPSQEVGRGASGELRWFAPNHQTGWGFLTRRTWHVEFSPTAVWVRLNKHLKLNTVMQPVMEHNISPKWWLVFCHCICISP